MQALSWFSQSWLSPVFVCLCLLCFFCLFALPQMMCSSTLQPIIFSLAEPTRLAKAESFASLLSLREKWKCLERHFMQIKFITFVIYFFLLFGFCFDDQAEQKCLVCCIEKSENNKAREKQHKDESVADQQEKKRKRYIVIFWRNIVNIHLLENLQQQATWKKISFKRRTDTGKLPAC